MKAATRKRNESGLRIKKAVKDEYTRNNSLSGAEIRDKLFRDKNLRKDIVLFSNGFIPMLVEALNENIDIMEQGYSMKADKARESSVAHPKPSAGVALSDRTECVCGVKMNTRGLAIHKGQCKIWKKRMRAEFNSPEVLEMIDKEGINIVARKYGFSATNTLRVYIKGYRIRKSERVAKYRETAKAIVDANQKIRFEDFLNELKESGFTASSSSAKEMFGAARKELGIAGSRPPTASHLLRNKVFEMVRADSNTSEEEIARRLKEGDKVELKPKTLHGYFLRACRMLGLHSKPARESIPAGEKAGVVKTSTPTEHRSTQISINPTAEQIVEAVSWMTVELKRLKQENAELLAAMQGLAGKNRDFSSSIAKLTSENSRQRDIIRKVNEQRVELQMRAAEPDNSLTGKKSAH